jgi:hypothetical protein
MLKFSLGKLGGVGTEGVCGPVPRKDVSGGAISYVFQLMHLLFDFGPSHPQRPGSWNLRVNLCLFANSAWRRILHWAIFTNVPTKSLLAVPGYLSFVTLWYFGFGSTSRLAFPNRASCFGILHPNQVKSSTPKLVGRRGSYPLRFDIVYH